MRRCYVDRDALYHLLCHTYEDDKTFHGATPTYRLRFLGNTETDLRCVRLRYSWEAAPSLGGIDLAAFDGFTEETEDYDVMTFSRQQILDALMHSPHTDRYAKRGLPQSCRLVKNRQTEVGAWLFFPSEEGRDFRTLRPQIEALYGIRFPASLAA